MFCATWSKAPKFQRILNANFVNQLKILALCPEHPKRDQNPKFTPLSETTSIPVCFIYEFPPPPGSTVVECKCGIVYYTLKSGFPLIRSILRLNQIIISSTEPI